MTEIPSTPADGNMLVTVVPAIANPAAPTLTELTAGTDISCYLTADGFTPGLEEQVIADERLCSTETYEQPGRSQRTLSVTYIDNTNSPNEVDSNKAKETLTPYSVQYLVTRRGLAYDEPLAADQKVTVQPITPGKFSDLPPEANSVLKITQKLFITGATRDSVPVTSGV